MGAIEDLDGIKKNLSEMKSIYNNVMTVDLLRKCLPYASDKNFNAAAPHLIRAMVHYKIDTQQRQAPFLANVAHESGSLEYTEEIASGDAYDTRTDLGNTPEKDGDGRKWKGHGYFETTGYFNHLKAAKEFGKTIEEIGPWLETHAGASWSAAFFWDDNALNQIADKPDSWTGNRGKFKNLTKFEYIVVVINGGLTHLDRRLKHLRLIQSVLR
jgi:putative chitinase